MRQIGLILGSAAVTIGISLASFMAGLAIGSVVLGRIADSRARPERLYGWLETGIGVYGLFSPFIFLAGQSVFHALADLPGGGPAFGLWVRGTLSFALLLVPTFLMGGTYPAAIRYLAPTMDGRGLSIGLFYATNTLGAAAAAFLFPTLLLEALGMRGVTCLAALCNILAAVGAFCLLPPFDDSPKSRPTTPQKASGSLPKPTASPYYIGAAMLLSGFAALGLETLYNRVLILTFGSSIYSFSFILGVYLTGIGIGGWIFTWSKERQDARLIFFLAQALVFVHLLISIPFLDRAGLLQMNLYDFFSGGQFLAFHVSNILTAAILCGPLAIGFGLGYPAAMKSLAEARPDIGAQIGLWGAVNGLGSTLGSLLITFLFLPQLGSYRCFQLMACAAGLSILLIGLSRGSIRWSLTPLFFIGGALFLHARYSPPWDIRYFHTQICVQPAAALDTWRLGGFEKKNLDVMQVKSFKEGRDGTVSVVEFRDEGGMPGRKEISVSLFVNGKVDASDNYSDLVTQSMLGHLPMQIAHSSPAGKSALVIGMGSGMTAGTLAEYPLARLDIAEISPDVVDAARRFYAHINRGVLEDTRVRIFVEDGRNFLAAREAGFQYDFIVNEPSNVWMSGASNLFTREYFTLVRQRLKPDGVLCQWFQMYTMSWESLSTLLATLHCEFPEIRVFNFSHAGFSGDLLILAAQKPLALTPAFLERLDPRITRTAHLDAIKNVNDLLRGYVMGTAELDRLRDGRRLHTDDMPVLELRGPRDLFAQSSKSNLFHFIEHAPELTFDWTVEPGRAAEFLGVEPSFDAADVGDIGTWGVGDADPARHPPSESGVRVVTFYDETRTFLHRQSFEYARWDLPGSGRAEIFSPLIGMTPQPAHRLTLAGFSKKSAETAKEFTLKDGRLVTMFERPDTAAARSYFAWNCFESKKTFFLRVTAAVGDGQPSGKQAAELFTCRIRK